MATTVYERENCLGDPQITLPSRTFRQKNHICCIHSQTKIMALKRIVFEEKLGQIGARLDRR